MKTLLIGMAAAGLVGVTTARAEQQPSTTDKSTATTSSPTQTQKPGDSSMSQTPSSSSQTSTTPAPSSGTGATASASSSGTGATASASSELSGVVKKIDKDKHSLKISSTTGGEQELKVADSATITRDGNQAGLDQIKEGDQVRASFDASGSNVSKIEVTSKQKVKTDDKDKTGLNKEK
jgi:Cu/Ag efflux protein CusF